MQIYALIANEKIKVLPLISFICRMNVKKKLNSGFIAIVTVFFFWGFVAASNGIIIPMFKHKFNLSNFQAQGVDFAFYLAYFVGSLIYYLSSKKSGDLLIKYGYKKGLIAGLLLSAFGALLLIPAAQSGSYVFMLLVFFTIGLGFALQQIVANPLVSNFGDPSKGAHRLSLAGGINSFGTTIGPVLISIALFGKIVTGEPQQVSDEAFYTPALLLFSLLVICAIVIYFNEIPSIGESENQSEGFKLQNYPSLIFGMIAIFLYVGVEVTIQSNLGFLLEMKEIKGLDHRQIAPYISLYWGSLMIGRWTGAITVFNLKGVYKTMAQIVVPLIAFLVLFAVNELNHRDTSDFIGYLPFVALAIVLFIVSGDNAAVALRNLAGAALVMMLIGLFSKGDLAWMAFTSGGLFCSVMWPCIFSLSIAGMGKYTNLGSSLLVMMILGGAIVPPIQGYLADVWNPHISYVVAVVCFGYLCWFGAYRSRLTQNNSEASVLSGNRIKAGH